MSMLLITTDELPEYEMLIHCFTHMNFCYEC